MIQKKLSLENETAERLEEIIKERNFTSEKLIEYFLELYDDEKYKKRSEEEELLEKIKVLIQTENKVNKNLKIILESLNKFFYNDSKLFNIRNEDKRKHHKFILAATEKVKREIEKKQVEKFQK